VSPANYILRTTMDSRPLGSRERPTPVPLGPVPLSNSRRPGPSLLWTLVLVPPLFIVALLTHLWAQWRLPAEDDFGLIRSCVYLAIGGFVIGLATARTDRKRTRLAFVALLLLPFAPLGLMWLAFLTFLVAVAMAGACATYVLARTITSRRETPWRIPLAIALCPLLFALAASVPPLDSYKWLWPWSSFRPRILAFIANADTAADRLGYPRGRHLTPDELKAWATASPLMLRLTFPVIHQDVIISVVSPGSDGRMQEGAVWMWWSYRSWRTFGPMNVKTMYVEWGDD
jgi:hypothetical protein